VANASRCGVLDFVNHCLFFGFKMNRFSKRSLRKLATCHPDLQRLFREVIKHFDCMVGEGYRGKQRQASLFNQGRSRLEFPNSEHNKVPSRAIDAAPWPVDWTDRDRFHFFAGFVLSEAIKLGIPIRWGGCWSGNWVNGFRNNKFDDLAHFELI